MPYLDRLDLDIDKVKVTIQDSLIIKAERIDKSKTYKSIEKLNSDLDGDEFLELKLRNSSKDYSFWFFY